MVAWIQSPLLGLAFISVLLHRDAVDLCVPVSSRSGRQRSPLLSRAAFLSMQGEDEKKTTEPLVKVRQLDHIALGVSNVETSMRFYSEMLGLPVERVELWMEGKVPFPSVRLNDFTLIDFFHDKDLPADGSRIEHLNHLCLIIDPQDMQQLREAFEARGVKVQSGPATRWGAQGDGTSVYVYDPDGNVVELKCHAPGEARFLPFTPQ
mmetsp:Transcript_7573/g.14766  ORF Transcript_7573/g.14766 Transcript_7573/m.14766 type:complete len:207 (-) Transcript_7573:121-741(-)